MEAAELKEVGGLSLQQLLRPVCCSAAPSIPISISISIPIPIRFRGFLQTLRGVPSVWFSRPAVSLLDFKSTLHERTVSRFSKVQAKVKVMKT